MDPDLRDWLLKRGNRLRAHAYLTWLGVSIGSATLNNWTYGTHLMPERLASTIEQAITLLMNRVPGNCNRHQRIWAVGRRKESSE